MKPRVLEYLACPACLPEEKLLNLIHPEILDGDVIGGALKCGCCGREYWIKEGIAFLTDESGSKPHPPPSSVYENPDMLSAYLWSHYADILGDLDATDAYSEWAQQIRPTSGAALDAGCATGRFCFELSSKCDFVIGVDLSENFISTARRIMKDRRISFHLKEEGSIHSQAAFDLPEKWDSEKVEFIVADASALPFRSGTFACMASLNLVDKIPHPLAHIKEIDRTARPGEAQLLISDPFSWSETVCAPEQWLGGTTAGDFAGYGIDNITDLLSGRGRSASFEWKIMSRGAVWWKIRNHRNHFELIRSQFVKADR